MQHDEELALRHQCLCRLCVPMLRYELVKAIADLENRVMKSRDFEWLLYEMQLALIEIDSSVSHQST